MTITKGLNWNDLSSDEQVLVNSSGRLDNPKEFNYHRVAGQLYACDEDNAYQITVPAKYSDEYEDEFFGADGDEDAIVCGACLLPITTDAELAEAVVCTEYLGIKHEHISDFSIGF